MYILRRKDPLKYGVMVGQERVPVVIRPGNTALLQTVDRLHAEGEREQAPDDGEMLIEFDKRARALLDELFGVDGAQKVGAYYDWQPLEIGRVIFPLIFNDIIPALERENKKMEKQFRRWNRR